MSRSTAFLLASAAACLCIGCVLAPPSGGSAETTPQVDRPADALRGPGDQQGNPDVPKGCSMTWSQAEADSVLYCPDVRPPAR